MKFKRWISQSKDTRRKYEYYLGLGYSETAAKVMSTVTYGNREVAFIVNQLGNKNVIEKLHSWLRERKEESPEEALNAFIWENRPRPEAREEVMNPAWFAGMGKVRAQGSAPRRVAAKKAPASCSCTPGIAPWISSESVHNAFAGLKESLSTDEYEPIEEKDGKNIFTAPTSTFRMTTSNASMGIVLNQIRSGRRVNMDQVRIEEILNYFDYDVKPPKKEKFAICAELMEKKGNKKILFIGAQAAREKKEHQNIILLLDTSGSMYTNTEVTQETIATIFSKLKTGDRISLVTYSTEDHTYFEGFEIKDDRSKEELMGIILGIEITGCTYGSAGIKTAYAIGEKFYRPDWNNQVILITDGDLNFGITDKHGLKGLIEEKKKSNLFLSVIGTGLYNYKDDKLEVLSKHGNGTYCVVNSLDDVDESINRRFIGLTNIVAKDVKAQVEFNPRFVKSYRLLGYENRELNHEDFKNDAVISEPYGSGGHGIALYELEMNGDENPVASSDLKYQKPVLTGSDELGTVSVRYKEPLEDKSYMVETVINNSNRITQNIQLAYFLYCISEKLRGSDRLDEYDDKFLEVMIASEFYKKFSGPNKKKLEMLLDALKHNGERKDDYGIPPWMLK